MSRRDTRELTSRRYRFVTTCCHVAENGIITLVVETVQTPCTHLIRAECWQTGRTVLQVSPFPHPYDMGLSHWSEEYYMSFLKKAKIAAAAHNGQASAKQVAWAARYPALWEYLSATQYPDGSERQTSCLTAFVEAGEWRLCLNDRAESQSAWVASLSLEDALLALDEKLQSGEVEWRRSWGAGQGKKPQGGQKKR